MRRGSHGIRVSKPQFRVFTVFAVLPFPLALHLSPLWTSSLCPSLPLAAPPLCPLFCTFSPTFTFLLPFSPLLPFCSYCLCLFLAVSPSPLCSATLVAIPLPKPSEVPGSAPLGVVPTSLSHLPQEIFLLLGEAGLQRFWLWVLCEEYYLKPEDLSWETSLCNVW